MKTLSFSTLWSNGFMMVIVASSSFANVQRSRYWLCFQIVVGRNVQHRIVVGEVCRCHCKRPCSGDCELETAADCTSTGCSPSKLLTACQLHALHHWVLKNATEKDWNTDCSFPLTDAAAGAIAPVRVATANCAKARLTCCRGQGFVLHGFLCSLFSCACWCACVVVVGVIAWPVVSASVSPILWMYCLCVFGLGAHLDCVTKITAPLPCKVSLFELSISSVVLFHNWHQIVYRALTALFSPLALKLFKGSRPWSIHCTCTLLYAHCAHGTPSLYLTHFGVSPILGNPPIYIIYRYIYRRKFRSQTSDNMERWKAEQGRGTEKRKIRREKIRRERVRGQKIQMREKVGKSRNTVFFQWFVAQEGRKVGSLKRRVRSQLATGAMKNCTPLWREAHFQVKMYKTPGVRTTFGSWDVEKVHAVVARSTFPSQNVQNTSASDHFWKLRCRKSARRCGAKHISKSKCTKHTILGPLLEVAMSKKCTPLWREAHFQVKSVKNWRSRTTFGGSDVEKVSKKCTPLWREAHFEVKSVKNWGFWGFFDVKMSKK